MTFTGRIYKIVNDVDNRIYIGSTKNTLRDRMYSHRSASRQNTESKIYRFMREVGEDHFKILLIEEREFKSRDEMVSLEDEYIKKYNTINEGLNEYYATLNLQRKRESRKKYVEENKKAYMDSFNKCRQALRSKNIETKRFVCEVCGYVAFDKQRLESHMKSKWVHTPKQVYEQTKYHCLICNSECNPYPALIERHNNTKKRLSNLIYVKF